MSGKLYKRKDGYWYYKYSFVDSFGYMKWRMVSCKTKDDEVAVQVKSPFDKKFGGLRNPFSNPKYTYSEMKDEYLKSRKLKVKRGMLSELTYKSDFNSLNRFSDWLQNKYGSDGYTL